MKQSIPKHVAIICDGNRRWARERNLPTFEGHRRGFENTKKISKAAKKIGIKILTYWVFSTENWNRLPDEVAYLMKLFETNIDEQLKEALKEKIRIVHIGRKDRISEKLKEKIINAENKTKQFTEFTLVIALDYGGKDEIIRAVQKITHKGIEVTEENINLNLDTNLLSCPEPDLVIRTSGETRISGFMIWQSAYSEYIFVKKNFPDFNEKDLIFCIEEYNNRSRRYGK